ncbi:MAG: endonuclease domain-containing protein [Sphingomonadales bacterium]
MSHVRARVLRQKQTDAERKLWYALRDRRFEGFKFCRQFPIGPFFADFLCRREKLVVEVDGGQHADRVERDNARTAFLEAQGYRVIRFWNNDVLTNIEGVMTLVRLELPETPSFPARVARPPHPSPLPRGERGQDGAPES